MAVVKKYKPDAVYIPERIQKKLSTIFQYNYSVIEAPTGYGKSTLLKAFLKEKNTTFIWFNVDGKEKKEFYSDFCKRISTIDKISGDKLSTLCFPEDLETARKIAEILIRLNLSEKTILVLDNYHLISNDYLNRVFKDVTGCSNSMLNIVLLTREITSGLAFELIYKKHLNHLGKRDLSFDLEEIEKYAKCSGILLNDDESIYLYKHTEGWIGAVHLQLAFYATNGYFEVEESVNSFMLNGIWQKVSARDKDFLTCMSLFEEFTQKQGVALFREELTEKEIQEIIQGSPLISSDAKERKYYIHSLFHKFLNEEFENREPEYKHRIYKRIANWYKDCGEFFTALRYYYIIKDYESILSMDYSVDNIAPHFFKKNKQFFMDVVMEASENIKYENIEQYMIYLVMLFLFNEADSVLMERKMLLVKIDKDTSISIDKKDALRGELKIIESLCEFNDIEKMGERLKEAEELIKGPSKIFYGFGTFLFSCPTPISLYYMTPGELFSTVEKVEYYSPYLYRLTGGSGKGTEALMHAQALFYRGDFGGAEILAQKALYMAESRSEISVILGTLRLIAKIEIFTGNTDLFLEIESKLEALASRLSGKDQLLMLGMVRGSLGLTLGMMEDIPSWLKSTEKIEENCHMINLGFANSIYGKYLILTEEYTKLLGISGQFIGIAKKFSSILHIVYLYIYIAIANFKSNNQEKGKKFLEEAVRLAVEDYLLVPFAENYHFIDEIVPLITMEKEHSEFIKKAAHMGREFEKGKEGIRKILFLDRNRGLTKREAEVARLAAMRLSNKEIAQELFIAESTVKSNMKIIFNKLGINNRVDLKNFF